MTLYSAANQHTRVCVVVFVALLIFWHSGVASEAPRQQLALAEEAAKLERDGRKGEAISVYEELAKQDPLAVKLAAARLVRLYAATGNTAAAVRWAEQVVKDHPDPEAYLAGVQSLCGNYAEAEAILVKALTAKNIPRLREIMLRWQLAEALEKQNRDEEAEAVLRKALTLAKDHPEEKTALRRLKALQEKRAAQ